MSISEPYPALQAGKQIHDLYLLGRELGEGGMARVYLATDLKHKRPVAIKVLKPEIAAALGAKRFVREIEIAARLSHPHILPLFNSGEWEGSLYYVMPYVEGESLRQRLHRQGPLPVAEAVRLVAQIAGALAYAHALGVIHRDIKPENILLSHDQAIVADFGIARALEAAGEGRLTQSGLAIGTPAYMSPEQALGSSDIDGRADVYALGCVLYEMLSGRPPFDGPTPLALLARHAADTAPRLRASTPDLPVHVEHAVHRAMAKDPGQRFQTAAAFAEAIATGSLPGKTQPRHAVWGGRTLPTVAALVVLAVAVVVGTRPRSDGGGLPQFTQLTDFTDAAWAPSLSPDGRTVVFLKGRGGFANSAGQGQVYVKALPDGDPVPLTQTPNGKATPTFSPDGSRVAFTSAEGNFGWKTYTVSVHGGPVTEWLPNASGLSWLDQGQILFAQIRQGIHMGIRRATTARDEVRDVYWPSGELGMAHRAAASPDRQWVLVVEMDNGIWQPCRLVPIDGSSRGRQVGPLGGQCTEAAWSPDGRWMYFSSDATGAFHLWRQRFPDGAVQQLTHGPTEEEGLAIVADGRSLITSAGVRINSIRLMDSKGDRDVSVEGFAFAAVASKDGSRVFFLSHTGAVRGGFAVGSLIATSVNTGAREALLPDFPMLHFDLSADDRVVAFVSGNDEPSKRGIWIAPLDRSAAPRRVYDGKTDRVFFDPAGNLYFLADVGAQRFLQRVVAPAYGSPEQIDPEPIFYLFSMSPDGQWLVGVSPRVRGSGLEQVGISTRGLPRRVLCAFCSGGGGPARLGGLPVSWTRDGRALVVSGQFITSAAMPPLPYSILVPLQRAGSLPDVPSGGIRSAEDYLRIPGARTISRENVFPGATSSQLLFYEPKLIRNLYRVRLPE